MWTFKMCSHPLFFLRRILAFPLIHAIHICFNLTLTAHFSQHDRSVTHLMSFLLILLIVPFPKSQTRHPARAQFPLHLPYIRFWHRTNLCKLLPKLPVIVICIPKRQGWKTSARVRDFMARAGANGLGATPNLEKMAAFLKSFVWRPVYGEKVEPR